MIRFEKVVPSIVIVLPSAERRRQPHVVRDRPVELVHQAHGVEAPARQLVDQRQPHVEVRALARQPLDHGDLRRQGPRLLLHAGDLARQHVDLGLLVDDRADDRDQHAGDDGQREQQAGRARLRATGLVLLDLARLLAPLLEGHQVDADHLSPTFLRASPMPTVRNGATVSRVLIAEEGAVELDAGERIRRPRSGPRSGSTGSGTSPGVSAAPPHSMMREMSAGLAGRAQVGLRALERRRQALAGLLDDRNHVDVAADLPRTAAIASVLAHVVACAGPRRRRCCRRPAGPS